MRSHESTTNGDGSYKWAPLKSRKIIYNPPTTPQALKYGNKPERPARQTGGPE